jgi:diguanylate cyclase (GGDEF)-like protein
MKDRYDLNAQDVHSLVDQAASDAAGILDNFEIPSSQLRPYSELLQEANEELFRLNLTYDQLLQKFAAENAKAEMLANELREVNQKLSELVGTDGLTGLCNYRYFHMQLHNEMLRAQRYMHSVSLVIIDIDNFKQVNDNHGHLDGDLVLKSVAGIIWGESRKTDTVARYGGEEFIVILPETDLKGAASFAERVRKKIEAHTVSVANVTIEVTVSLGVCVCDPKKCTPNSEDFIKAADKALYHSKNNGKNRLSVASL